MVNGIGGAECNMEKSELCFFHMHVKKKQQKQGKLDRHQSKSSMGRLT